MPVAFEGPPTELAGLSMFLDEQRAALLRKLDGLSLEQATTRPTSSELCMLTLVKHVAFTERRWMVLEVARRDAPGLWPPPDDREWRVEPEDTVDSIAQLYREVIAESRAILDESERPRLAVEERAQSPMGVVTPDRGSRPARGTR